MRRKIDLYIGGKKADLDEQDFILYNYAFTDLETPSAVKNSFSKQITLPATPANLAIFGHPHRTERVVGAGGSGIGTDFNPGLKTPFEIRNEMDCILESGYIRLDCVTMKNRSVQGLKITLFGGIGSFFYNLSYNADGSKKTLGDLAYAVSLTTFTINRTTVGTAWSRLNSHAQSAGIEQVWDIVNFAPAYNGIPEGDFAADTAIIEPADAGLEAQVIEGDNVYETKDDYALLKMKTAHDEWACKDLRSYLQRPVLSMRAFLEAICNSANNGGYSVDISQIPTDTYVGVWKTLPMLSSLGSLEEVTGSTSLRALVTAEGDVSKLGVFNYLNSVPVGASVDAYGYFQIGFKITNQSLTNPKLKAPYSNSVNTGYQYVVVFCQLIAKAGTTTIDTTSSHCFTQLSGFSISEIATACNYTPATSLGSIISPTLGTGTNGEYYFSQYTPQMRIQSEAVSEYVLDYKCYVISTNVSNDTETIVAASEMSAIGLLNESGNTPAFYNANSTHINGLTSSVTYTTTQKLRTGAVISFANLLSSAYTPAEYLVSFCKMNGLVFSYNPAGKSITILHRNSWFNGETTDLSGLVDRSQTITINPLALKSKWYEMKGSIVEGARAKDYENKYGVQYGIQRINTGYDFDAATEDLMKSVVFKNAVTILDSNGYWNRLTKDGNFIPSIFLDAGNTYTLWNGDGEGKDFNVPIPDNSASIAYYNSTYKGYDKPYCPKLEFRDASNKALDGADVLCRYARYESYSKFVLTDDTVETLALNNGKPCWHLFEQGGSSRSIPIFHSYEDFSSSHTTAARSLDYGIPREIDMPGLNISTTTGSIYLRSWKNYLADVLNQNTKVMKCRVDLTGFQVGPELLRRFYYYEGSLWVLNKITNYSLTTWDPVECEFVQVQDKTNYTNGQIL